MAAQEACCGSYDVLDDARVSDDLDLSDPTLSSCCRRDLLDQRRTERLTAILAEADRIDARGRVTKSVVIQSRPELLCKAGSETGEESTLSDEENTVLRKFREQRLRQVTHRHRQQASESVGRGQLKHVTEAQALENIRDQNGLTVLHLTVDGDKIGQDLDEHLETLAHRHKETRFVRAILTRQSHIPPQVGMPHAPALLIFRDSALTAKALIGQFTSDGTLLEEQVTRWLKQRSGTRSPNNTSSDSDSEECEELDWREPCEICGRRYFHEHMSKTLYASTAVESDD